MNTQAQAAHMGLEPVWSLMHPVVMNVLRDYASLTLAVTNVVMLCPVSVYMYGCTWQEYSSDT